VLRSQLSHCEVSEVVGTLSETYARLHTSVDHPFFPTTDNTMMNTTFPNQSRKKNVTPMSLILLMMAPKLAITNPSLALILPNPCWWREGRVE